MKAGEGIETARRLGREQLFFVFLAASPLVHRAHQNRHATQARVPCLQSGYSNRSNRRRLNIQLQRFLKSKYFPIMSQTTNDN